MFKIFRAKTNTAYRLLISSYAISTFSEGVIVPIYAIFVQKIGGDILDAGLAMGLFLITQGLFTMVFHKLRFRPVRRLQVMILGWLVWLIGIALYLFVSNIWILFLTQVLTALGNALANPIFDEELSEHTNRKEEEFQWALFEGGNDFMSGLAAIAGGVIAATLGFIWLIWLMIAAATLSLVIILFYIRRFRRGSLLA